MLIHIGIVLLARQVMSVKHKPLLYQQKHMDGGISHIWVDQESGIN